MNEQLLIDAVEALVRQYGKKQVRRAFEHMDERPLINAVAVLIKQHGKKQVRRTLDFVTGKRRTTHHAGNKPSKEVARRQIEEYRQHMAGATFQQIADDRGLSVTTVKRDLNKASRILRRFSALPEEEAFDRWLATFE